MNKNEQSWICTGGTDGRLWFGHLSHESEGHPGSVDFPHQWVNQREEKIHDVVGFMHTHPQFSATPSFRDLATMHAWVASFGKPLMCLILGVDGLKAYLFYDDESMPIRCKTAKQFGQLVMVILPPKKLYVGKPTIVLNNQQPVPVQRVVCDLIDEDELDEGEFDDDITPHILDWDEYEHCDS